MCGLPALLFGPPDSQTAPTLAHTGALRGTYRVFYRIDEDSRIVHVLDIDHRSEIYHRPQQ
jgi:ParE toxin of type II toxin-antitoxin system, parDE